jgi:uncharacterized protein YdeI (YjbR/CyaY-like superfamily)
VVSRKTAAANTALPPDAVDAPTRAAWRAWLKAHHDQLTGVWLVMAKKAGGDVELDYDTAVEEALCWGWIDSKPRTLDATRSLLYFAPRKAGTGWSALNKARVERAIAAGCMAAPGLAKVQAAQADGSWAALDAVERLEVPADLAQALDALPPAAALFDAFPRSAKRGILEWILQAKTEATRAKRVQETATLAQRGERANQWPRPKA